MCGLTLCMKEGRGIMCGKKEIEEDYLKNFDEVFGTKTSKSIKLNMPLLKNIFNNFREDIYFPSKKHDRLRNKEIELYEKLKESLSDEQIKEINKIMEIQNQMTEEVEEQLFLFGFVVATELSEEVKTNIKKNKNTKKE